MFKMSFLQGGVSGVDVGALGWLYGLAVFRELATTGFSSSAADVLERINAARGRKLTLGEVVQGVYEHNVRPVRYPREYEFKNELVRSVFSGGWDFPVAVQLEQPCGASRADMVAYYAYGCAHAYEIKTERDSLARLPRQVENYRRAYPQVTVVTTLERVSEVAEVVPPQVGISALADWEEVHTGRRYVGIEPIRYAQRCTDELEVDAMTSSMRTVEPGYALEGLGVEPVVRGCAWTRNREALAEYVPAEIDQVLSGAIYRNRVLLPHQVEILEAAPAALSARIQKFLPNKTQARRIMRALNATELTPPEG